MLPISRPAHSSDTKAAHTGKAPEPQAGGTAEGTSSTQKVSHKKPEGVPGMKPKEEKLAGYLMARASVNRKVEGRDLDNLRAGHESVQQACGNLPLGRSNVIQDIEKGRGVFTPFRHQAANVLISDLMREMRSSGRQPTRADFRRAGAAADLYAKTGTCSSYAEITIPVHAAKLPRMKDTRSVVAQAQNNSLDHAWAEMIPNGRRQDGAPNLHGSDVVMDGWCKEHLAVLREDSHFARLNQDGKADHLTHHDFLDHRTGQAALRAVVGFKERIDGSTRLRNKFQKAVDDLVAKTDRVSKKGFWNDTSIFHADFREQAGMALHPKVPSPGEGSSNQGAGHPVEKTRSSAMSEIQAVGVSRSLGANIRGAVAEAPKIIASAKDMFPDPRRPLPPQTAGT